jgi:hypothetical protein
VHQVLDTVRPRAIDSIIGCSRGAPARPSQLINVNVVRLVVCALGGGHVHHVVPCVRDAWL